MRLTRTFFSLATAIAVLAACSERRVDSMSPLDVDEPPRTSLVLLGPPMVTTQDRLEFSYPRAWAESVEVPYLRPDLASDAPPSTIAVEAETLDLSEPIQLPDTLMFDRGSAILSAGANGTLQLIAAAAVQQMLDGEQLHVDAYVDEVGTPESNTSLSNERGAAVTNRLVRLEPSLHGRIATTPHGEDDLRDPECHGDCATNRVVVISVCPDVPGNASGADSCLPFSQLTDQIIEPQSTP